MGRDDAPLLFRLRWDPALFDWSLRFLRKYTPERTRTNIHDIVSLAQALMQRTLQLFPELHPAAEPEFWCGLRPSTPSSVPFIGRSLRTNLYLNTGHGTLGWTMACRAAAALADIISGQEPEISLRRM